MNRAQSQPKYKIVEDYLRAMIRSGEVALDALLPTEEVLCTRFGISRSTVRTALGNLQSDGLIVRSAAIGSRVVATANRQAFRAGWNSVEDLLQYTKAVRLHVRTITEIVLDKAGAAEIGFGVGRSVVRVSGVRWNQDQTDAPLCTVEIYFDSLFNGIVPQIGITDRPIADLIDDQYRVRIDTIRQEISAATLPVDVATSLSAPDASPALIIKRWYCDPANRMFQMTKSQYPADRFRYVVDFGREKS